ncbi:MAG: purine-binding chemotaxis protein CheW [Oscillatoriales cyanobacterium]|nr:MAG: purine-binding chemotaxis protein CheW [Oscillatoriales cyanobacterium]TAH20898.1 MAG: purine-binding chemotaxis protein CheW [Oscillatoriales cyanobacterium]
MKKNTPLAAPNHTSGTKQFLVFAQGDSLFGVELEAVREVLSLKEQPLEPVPNTLPFLLGLTNLRGEILAVADFGHFTGIAPVDIHNPNSRILVVEAPDPRDARLSKMRIGLAVSRVEGVLPLNPDRTVSAVDVSADLAPFLKGLYNCDGRLLMIVDIEAIAHSERW